MVADCWGFWEIESGSGSVPAPLHARGQQDVSWARWHLGQAGPRNRPWARRSPSVCWIQPSGHILPTPTLHSSELSPETYFGSLHILLKCTSVMHSLYHQMILIRIRSGFTFVNLKINKYMNKITFFYLLVCTHSKSVAVYSAFPPQFCAICGIFWHI